MPDDKKPRGRRFKNKNANTAILFVADMPRTLMNAFAAWCRMRELVYRDVLSEMIREKIGDTSTEDDDD